MLARLRQPFEMAVNTAFQIANGNEPSCTLLMVPQKTCCLTLIFRSFTFPATTTSIAASNTPTLRSAIKYRNEAPVAHCEVLQYDMEGLSWPVMFESVVSLICTSFFHLACPQCNNSWLTWLRLLMIWVVLVVRPPSACAHRGVSVRYPASFVFSFLLPSSPASQHPDAVRSPVKPSSGLCTHSTAETPRIPSRSPFFNSLSHSTRAAAHQRTNGSK